jgi:hypothetical protein
MGNRITSTVTFFSAAFIGLLTFGPNSGCSSKTNGGTAAQMDDGGGSSSGGGSCTGFGCASGDDSGASTTPVMTCNAGSNWQCKQVSCPNGGTTTLTGTVYDPAGKIPLWGVAVYVPNDTPQKFTDGVSCGSCSSLYTSPVVSTLTDEGGQFKLTNMPVGDNVPLIVQVGKWRMQYKLKTVAQCASNDAASLTGTKLRMPRNHMEGDLPNIAVSTGAADSLECLLLRMGVDAAEYTGNPTGAGRIKIFTGGDAPNGRGGAVTNAPMSKQSYQYLWNRDDSMDQFDLVLLSCEGNETSYLNDAGRQVLTDYTTNGGRVFASHYHYSWFTPTGPFSMLNPPLATWSTGNGIVGDGTSSYNADIVTTLQGGGNFAEGTSFKKWLGNVSALNSAGQLPIYYSRDNANVTATNTHSQNWVTLDPSSPQPNVTQYFSFDTPVGLGPSEQCGRVVYSDLHVSGGAGSQNIPNIQPDYPGMTTSGGIVPDGCDKHDLTAQEKALEFMIFDLTACLTPPTVTRMPPPTK